jgi:N-hydroxyarylamine O-acetyltransferase
MSSPTSIDLDAYCARIGYAGPRTPTLETLKAIHALHPQAIAFENLDPLLRRPVTLDAASLEAKLVKGGRGGWCFEQNGLFKHALEALGFRVTGLAGRVLWNRPDGTMPARSHMVLKLDVRGETFIADVGFGGLTLTAPLRLEADIEQQTPHETFRLARLNGGFRLDAQLRGEWKPVYRFDLAEQFPIDYEVSNHFLLTHPSSPFLSLLMAARVEPERRLALSNNELAVHHRGGKTERRRLGSPTEIRRVLEQDFALTLPDDPGLDAALARLG